MDTLIAWDCQTQPPLLFKSSFPAVHPGPKHCTPSPFPLPQPHFNGFYLDRRPCSGTAQYLNKA